VLFLQKFLTPPSFGDLGFTFITEYYCPAYYAIQKQIETASLKKSHRE
jgi:hypothetical protein